MYPIALWTENAFLAFYCVIFVISFAIADVLKFRSVYVRPTARWGITGVAIILSILHLITDLGSDRINKHWTGHAPAVLNFTDHSELVASDDYQNYWGENRRKIPLIPGKSGRRLALLPLVFLATVIAAQLYFRPIREETPDDYGAGPS